MASKLDWDGDEVLADFERAVSVALRDTSDLVASRIRRTMPGQGASVRQGTGGDTKRRAVYTPSNPGQPPGVRSETLQSSVVNEMLTPTRAIIGTNQPYAKHLEFGTRNMSKRPFLLPGFKKSRKRAVSRFRKVLAQQAGI